MPAETPDADSELVITRDGSHTVYSPTFEQHYHNPNGAVAESRYVFFEQTGLPDDLRDNRPVNILELGFGTGLNLLLLLDYYLQLNATSEIHYYSVEGYPLKEAIAADLNYGEHLRHPELTAELPPLFRDLTRGMNRFILRNHIQVHLFYGLFEHFEIGNIQADYIFHDAFSPEVNPDLWTGKVFQKVKSLSTADALLATYCAASKARGAMAWAGWNLARAPGALGKREMTLASLNPDRLGNLKRVNEKRMARRYEEGDFG